MRISSHLLSLIIPLILSGCDKIVSEKVTNTASVKNPVPHHLDAEFYALEYDKDINSSRGVRSHIGSYGPFEKPSKVSFTMDSGDADNRYKVIVDFTGTKGDQDTYKLTITHTENGAEKTSEAEVNYSGKPVEIWRHKNVHVGVMPSDAKK